MQGVFMGHLSFYNKNQIRDKLFTGSYFFGAGEVARLWYWIRKTVLHSTYDCGYN